MSFKKNKILLSKKKGILVISLDFELYWGVFDKIPMDRYSQNLIGSRKIIPKILELFEKYDVHATWAIVGILFCKDKRELLDIMSRNSISRDSKHSQALNLVYTHIESIGADEKTDPFHYASSLIKKISARKFQEIGTHTFSHYCILEKDSSPKLFEEDLMAARKVAKKLNLELKSIVFPRNQYNSKSLSICKKAGLIAYRGNPDNWLYRPRNEEELNFFIRILRYADTLVNLAGHNTFDITSVKKEVPINVPASRFTYWYIKPLNFLEPLRVFRIKSDMRCAARKGQIYHIWWHPHNFGVNIEENLKFLENILKEYKHLNKKYGMKSMNMCELANEISDLNEI